MIREAARYFVGAALAGSLVLACSDETKSGDGSGGAASGGSGGSGGSTGTGGTAGAAAAGGTAGSGGGGGVDLGGLAAPEPGLKVAFLGDQGVAGPSRSALKTVVDEGADVAMLLGDFDYDDDPAAWEAMLDEWLGPEFPWFAVVGNHDTAAWDAAPDGGEGYRAKIEKKLARMGDVDCHGEPGVKHACRYRGLHFVLSGVGLLGTGHEDFIRDELASSRHLWRMCGWHLNQQDMQAGAKKDAVGWRAFQECQTEGAFVASGHEHSYARTKTLTAVGDASAGHGAMGELNLLALEPGATFVLVNGAGGQSLRNYSSTLHDDDTWWANIYANDYELRDGQSVDAFNLLEPAGVAFLELGVDGDPRRARGYYKTIAGRIVDEFEVTIRR